MTVNIEPSWGERLKDEFEAPYFDQLIRFVRDEYKAGPCYPPRHGRTGNMLKY